tara:strand:+ start:19707 stop:20198 length:492 start_codon:yes stop_codon:yes gene_type:complete
MKEKMKVHYSSTTNEWATPNDLFEALDDEFGFTLDPCATDDNHKCKKYYTKETNGLIQDWRDEVVFMNPPYGRAIGKWVEKAAHETAHQDCTVVCLIPARPDTKYWHNYIFPYASEIRFLKGRVKFGDGAAGAPFPSAIVIFEGRYDGTTNQYRIGSYLCYRR